MTRSLRGLTSETLADQAYEAIRTAIASGELKRGEKITERGLAERLSVSATPVREALRRLEQDRLVERTGLRSVRVAAPDAQTVIELSLIEATLRAVAARLAAENATEHDLRAMATALDAADAERDALLAQDGSRNKDQATAVSRLLLHLREFHAVVDRACGNDILLHMLGMAEAFTLEERLQSLRDRDAPSPAQDARFAQHRALYDAIIARDGALAEELMLRHTREAGVELARSQL